MRTAGVTVGVVVATAAVAYVFMAPYNRGGMGEVYRARDTKLDRTRCSRSPPLVMDHRPRRI